MPVWAFNAWIWELLSGTYLIRPMLRRLQQNYVSTHAEALGLHKDHVAMNRYIFVMR